MFFEVAEAIAKGFRDHRRVAARDALGLPHVPFER